MKRFELTPNKSHDYVSQNNEIRLCDDALLEYFDFDPSIPIDLCISEKPIKDCYQVMSLHSAGDLHIYNNGEKIGQEYVYWSINDFIATLGLTSKKFWFWIEQ